MIPTPEEIAEAYVFVARRYGVSASPNTQLIGTATKEASVLAATPHDEPAALFFALARRQRAFPGLWTAVVGLLIVNHARNVGLRFEGEAKDLLPMFVPIARGSMHFEEVRAWFRGVLRPRTP
jgi:hypothetical protein